MDVLISFLCGIAGVRTDAQKRAWNARGAAATTGALIILIGIVAGLTMGYAAARAFVGDPHALAVALVAGTIWSAIVLCIDRSMTMGIDKNLGFWAQLRQAALRLPFAIAIGLTLSKPILLRVSSTVLDRELRIERREAIAAEAAANAEAERLDAKMGAVKDATTNREQQDRRLRGQPDSYEYQTATIAARAAETSMQRTMNANAVPLARVRATIDSLVAAAAPARDAERIGQLIAQAGRRQSEINTARTSANTARARLSRVAAEWYQAEQQTIRQLLPDGFDQDDALRVLFDRYDKLMKETYAEMKP